MLYLQTDILDLNRPFPFRFLLWSRCSLPQSCMDPDPGLTGIINPHRNIRIPCHIRIMRFECPAVGMAADHDVFDFEMPHGILKSRRKVPVMRRNTIPNISVCEWAVVCVFR